MAEYLLILVIYSGAPAITSILFPSKEACEHAQKASAGLVNNQARAQSICVPRRTP